MIKIHEAITLSTLSACIEMKNVGDFGKEIHSYVANGLHLTTVTRNALLAKWTCVVCK